MKSAAITGLTLAPVLGLPWLILVFNIAIHNEILEWIFIIVNGLLGLVFFVLIAIRNKQVLAKFRKNRRVYNVKPQPKEPVVKTQSGKVDSPHKSTNGQFRKKVDERAVIDGKYIQTNLNIQSSIYQHSAKGIETQSYL